MKFTALTCFMAFCCSVFGQNFNVELLSEMSFPGETVANIFGYTKDGKEYALVGGSQNTHIVDVTNPAAPVKIASLPFSNSLWKEIRVYKNVAYITTEGGGSGVQIIDLSGLPSATLSSYSYKGDGVIANQLQTVHALQIDETKGYLYLYGSNIGTGGAIVCNLEPNPYQPKYAGRYDGTYIHDGYADNDTLYGAHIGDGYFSVINMADKTNPVVITTQNTPTTFTHNTWITKDRKHLLTTDETSGSYLAMYDISDLDNITELDRLQCTTGSGSTGHNTYVRGDYAITAWYTDGVNIVDCTRPENIVQTGWYDTYAGSGAGFDGAWGVYPFFPSGNLVVSNIDPGKIYMLKPTYQRASYLEGVVKNAQTGVPIGDARVELTIIEPVDLAFTNGQGAYKTGMSGSGPVIVRCSKLGFIPQIVTIQLQAGVVTNFEFLLEPALTYAVTGTVRDAQGNAIPNAKISLQEPAITYDATADANGAYAINGVLPSNYSLIAGAWGFKEKGVDQAVSGTLAVDIVLDKGYKDDFALDQGWTVVSTASQGIFERADPVGLVFQGIELRPEDDAANDFGTQCYITGNNGSGFVDDDLKGGNTVLTSPAMNLVGYVQPKVKFSTFFMSFFQSGTPTNEKLTVSMNNGTAEKVLYTRSATTDVVWKEVTVAIPPNLPLTNNMKIIVRAGEAPASGDEAVTEAGFDAFEIVGTVSADEPLVQAEWAVQPNPFTDQLVISTTTPAEQVQLTDALGRVVASQVISQATSQISVTLPALQPGLYFVQLRTENGWTVAKKVLKVD